MLLIDMFLCLVFFFFFFKQKTAYEMRISDWSSDVCSSDLLPVLAIDMGAVGERIRAHGGGWLVERDAGTAVIRDRLLEIRGSSGERAARAEEVRHWQQGEGDRKSVV